MSQAKLKDDIKIKGRLQIKLNDDIVVDDDNLIVNSGKEWAAKMLGGVGQQCTRMKVGDNGAPPDLLDLDLKSVGAPGGKFKWLALTNPGGDVYVNTIEFISTLGVGEAFQVRECGLFDNQDSNTMIARKAFAEVNKDVNDVMSFIWTLTVV